jgi:hypothetical protein
MNASMPEKSTMLSSAGHLAARHAHDGALQVDVLAPGEVLVEARPTPR